MKDKKRCFSDKQLCKNVQACNVCFMSKNANFFSWWFGYTTYFIIKKKYFLKILKGRFLGHPVDIKNDHVLREKKRCCLLKNLFLVERKQNYKLCRKPKNLFRVNWRWEVVNRITCVYFINFYSTYFLSTTRNVLNK